MGVFRACGFHKGTSNPNVTSKTFSKTPHHMLSYNGGDGKPPLVFQALSPKEWMGGEETQVTSVVDGV